MQRKASAVWKGGLKDGKGTVSSTSGVLSNTPYSFSTRFVYGAVGATGQCEPHGRKYFDFGNADYGKARCGLDYHGGAT